MRFDGSTPSPTISFFIDGYADGTSTASGLGCGSGLPVAVGGSGENTAVIGANLVAGSRVGGVQLYHRYVSNTDIFSHALGSDNN